MVVVWWCLRCHHHSHRFLIPLDFDESTVDLNITALANYLWVDTMTRKLDVKFATYNGNANLFAFTQLTIDFDLTGVVRLGLGRIVALHYCSSTLYQIR